MGVDEFMCYDSLTFASVGLFSFFLNKNIKITIPADLDREAGLDWPSQSTSVLSK